MSHIPWRDGRRKESQIKRNSCTCSPNSYPFMAFLSSYIHKRFELNSRYSLRQSRLKHQFEKFDNSLSRWRTYISTFNFAAAHHQILYITNVSGTIRIKFGLTHRPICCHISSHSPLSNRTDIVLALLVWRNSPVLMNCGLSFGFLTSPFYSNLKQPQQWALHNQA